MSCKILASSCKHYVAILCHFWNWHFFGKWHATHQELETNRKGAMVKRIDVFFACGFPKLMWTRVVTAGLWTRFIYRKSHRARFEPFSAIFSVYEKSWKLSTLFLKSERFFSGQILRKNVSSKPKLLQKQSNDKQKVLLPLFVIPLLFYCKFHCKNQPSIFYSFKWLYFEVR